MDIQSIKSLEAENDLNLDSLLADFDHVTGFDIIEEAKEFSDIQKKFLEVASVVEEKTKMLENVADELESIESEKKSFDEWAKNVKEQHEKGENNSQTLKVINLRNEVMLMSLK